MCCKIQLPEPNSAVIQVHSTSVICRLHVVSQWSLLMQTCQAGRSLRACMETRHIFHVHEKEDLMAGLCCPSWLPSQQGHWELTWRHVVVVDRTRHPQRVGSQLLHVDRVGEQHACASAQPASRVLTDKNQTPNSCRLLMLCSCMSMWQKRTSSRYGMLALVDRNPAHLVAWC